MIVLLTASALFFVTALEQSVESAPQPPTERTMTDEQLIDLTLGLWAKCAETAAKDYASLKEPADAVADAAMAKCADDQSRYLRAIRAILGDLANTEKMRTELDELVEKQRKKIRDIALVSIFDYRKVQK